MRKKKMAKKQKNALPQLEKELNALSTKLIAACKKEINLLKQQTKNLQVEIKQIEKLQILAHKKSTHLELRKNQLTASEKKQWKAANKLKQELGKRLSFIAAKFPIFEKEIKNLEHKQDSYANLNVTKKQSKKSGVAQTPTREPLLQPPMFPNFSNFSN